jgi:hypothetical protein
MSEETYRYQDNFKPIFDDLVVLNKKLITLERDHLNVKVKVGSFRVGNFRLSVFSYMPLNVC